MIELGKVYKDNDDILWIVRNESQDNYCTQDMVAADPNHEKEVLDIMKSEITDNMVFIDIGAHLGYFSLRLAHMFKTIHAFEPSNFNREGLIANIGMNRICNINVHDIALGEMCCDDIILERGGGSRLRESCPTYIDNSGSTTIHKVKVSTLDNEFCFKGELPLLIKIDTEGMELPVLRGGVNLLKNNECYIMIEHHKMSSPELNDIDKTIQQYLVSLGYKEVWRNDEQQKFAFKNY